jgi:predicted RNA-binding Zn-ribbon protein involved in translation (DUF1610 family)
MQDVFYTPLPYISTVVAIALCAWIIVTLVAPDQSAAKENWPDAGRALPASTHIAIAIAVLFGIWSVVDVIWHLAQGKLFLNFGVLLVPAGLILWRRRSNVLRKGLLACVWCVMLVCAAILGLSLYADPLEYSFIQKAGNISSMFFVISIALVIAVSVWFWWALSNEVVRTIFQDVANRRRDPSSSLRRCGSCGYDLRATVVAGLNTCPECGQVLSYTGQEQATVTQEFEQANGPD